MTSLLFRLAFAGARSRRLAALLTIALTAAVAASIVMAVTVRSAASDPWERTFNAANGADVILGLDSQAAAQRVAGLPGVAQSSPPIPTANVMLSVQGHEYRIVVYGLTGDPVVNVPVQTSGSSLQTGGIVLERSLADALNIASGSMITLGSGNAQAALTVNGTAIVPSVSRYPRENPGVAWINVADLQRIQPDAAQWHWSVAIRLDNPDAVSQFVDSALQATVPGQIGDVSTRQQQRQNALDEAQPFIVVLSAFAIILLVVSVAVIVTLTAARMLSQEREFALLGSVGLTPLQIGLLALLEDAVLGLVGLGIGFVAGTLLMPRLFAPSLASMLGAPKTSVSWVALLVAALVILPVIAIASGRAAMRSARSGVSQRLVTTRRRPRGPIAAIARALPVALYVGVIDLVARRRSALLLGLSFLVSAAAIVASLLMRARLAIRPEIGVSDVPAELPRLVFTLDVVLGIIVATMLISTVLFAIREGRREFSILRTVGCTPAQVVTGLAGAYSGVAFIASIAAIPAGAGLFALALAASDGDDGSWQRPWLLIALVPIAIALLVWTMTALIARSVNRAPAAESLRTE